MRYVLRRLNRYCIQYLFITDGAFFKKAGNIKPHQYKGWLNSHDKLKNPDEFKEKVKEVCDTYKNAQLLQNEEVIVVCVDEKTGIQATEHKNPSKANEKGEVEKIEQEYIRNGTTGLIASRNVSTGTDYCATDSADKNRRRFCKTHYEVIDLSPASKYIFVMDQLNTHKSESLVRLIAQSVQHR